MLSVVVVTQVQGSDSVGCELLEHKLVGAVGLHPVIDRLQQAIGSHQPIGGSDGHGQLADSGELAIPAASLVDGGLPEVYCAGGLDLLGLNFAPGLLLGLED